MTPAELMRCFADWREAGAPLALATVYATEGSTYSKIGAQMLINSDGDFQGMLSGGCLEGDLAERARAVIRSGEAQTVTYDLGQDDEELWGLGVGCDGLMRIFLMRLDAARDYQPFAAIAAALAGDEVEVAAIVLDSDDAILRPGDAFVSRGEDTAWSGIADAAAVTVTAAARGVLKGGKPTCQPLSIGSGTATILFNLLRPAPRILVLGAGLDAQPLVRLASELGWRVTVQDHRPAYIENGDFSRADEVLCLSVEELAAQLDPDRYDAVIVMSHHLTTDREYLRMLSTSRVGYIGLLGPPHRRERLLGELGAAAAGLDKRLHGPAGIDIGASGPAAIALSIIAEMHDELCRRVNQE